MAQTEIPIARLTQAYLDVRNEVLWTKQRSSFRESLCKLLLKYQNMRHKFTQENVDAVAAIVGYNDSLRAPYDIEADGEIPLSPIQTEEANRLLHKEPPKVVPPHALRVVDAEARTLAAEELPEFNPRLTAVEVGKGLGFNNGAIVNALRQQYPDAPKPIEEAGRDTGLYLYSDWAAFQRRYRAEIDRRRTKGQKASTTRATTATRIAELERQLAVALGKQSA